jgi:uncharacterized membrane protein YgdD (TMEM256/DUF423 family)
MQKQTILTGIIFAMLAVILGAFGAHALKPIFTLEELASYETGVRYQMYHAFALIALGIIATNYDSKYFKNAYYLFLIGTILFSGSIYILNFLKSKSIIGLTGLGILTPIGGVCLIIAWLFLFLGIYHSKK